jgi:hypothetical protein
MAYPGQDKHTDSVNSQSAKDPAAVELGHKGGLAGGPARASSLSSKERSQIASLAADARWSEHQSNKHVTHSKGKFK